MSKRKYKVTFLDESIDDKFKNWSQKWEKVTYSAKCSIFSQTFDISNMGESALTIITLI